MDTADRLLEWLRVIGFKPGRPEFTAAEELAQIARDDLVSMLIDEVDPGQVAPEGCELFDFSGQQIGALAAGRYLDNELTCFDLKKFLGMHLNYIVGVQAVEARAGRLGLMDEFYSEQDAVTMNALALAATAEQSMSAQAWKALGQKADALGYEISPLDVENLGLERLSPNASGYFIDSVTLSVVAALASVSDQESSFEDFGEADSGQYFVTGAFSPPPILEDGTDAWAQAFAKGDIIFIDDGGRVFSEGDTSPQTISELGLENNQFNDLNRFLETYQIPLDAVFRGPDYSFN